MPHLKITPYLISPSMNIPNIFNTTPKDVLPLLLAFYFSFILAVGRDHVCGTAASNGRILRP